jgi:hypothetical protein
MRAKGAKNKMTKAEQIRQITEAPAARRRETIREIARDILGIDSLEQTGKISAAGVRVRQNIARVLQGERTISSERVSLLRLMMDYAYGTPEKMAKEESKKQGLVFVSHPWKNDPMKEQEAEAIAKIAAQEKLEAAAQERKLQGLELDPSGDEDPDAPQLADRPRLKLQKLAVVRPGRQQRRVAIMATDRSSRDLLIISYQRPASAVTSSYGPPFRDISSRQGALHQAALRAARPRQ